MQMRRFIKSSYMQQNNIIEETQKNVEKGRQTAWNCRNMSVTLMVVCSSKWVEKRWERFPFTNTRHREVYASDLDSVHLHLSNKGQSFEDNKPGRLKGGKKSKMSLYTGDNLSDIYNTVLISLSKLFQLYPHIESGVSHYPINGSLKRHMLTWNNCRWVLEH